MTALLCIRKERVSALRAVFLPNVLRETTLTEADWHYESALFPFPFLDMA